MKLDYQLLRKILEDVKAQDDFSLKKVDASINDGEDAKLKAYHYKLLVEECFISGMVRPLFDQGLSAYSIRYTGLTLQGHRLLEGMLNDDIWNKIKGAAMISGLGGLKKIPALAIHLILSGK
jgi:hypothetical protein